MIATHTETPRDAAPARAYNNPIGYLRAFIVVLVVAHHAALAYHPYAAPPNASLVAQPRLWQAFPVVDPNRTNLAMVLTGFNDTFFMSLMFLLSGLFVWSGLKRKGGAAFFRGRLLRLGAPFLVAAALVAPLAYYPAYLQTRGHAGFSEFVRQWLSLGNWPSGPAWFVWVLLAFDAIAAALFAMAPRWAETLGRFLAGSPIRLFAILATASALVYIPMELMFTGITWSAFGPFTFQTGRILHYLLYFLIGAGLGAWGLDRGALAQEGRLARRWMLWSGAAAVVFSLASAVTIIFLTAHLQSMPWRLSTDVMFAATCATTSFAFLALFLRFARSQSRFWDSLARNSYGIYLVHYAFVSWIGLGLVGVALPGALKFLIVTGTAVAGSWLTMVAIRKVPAVDVVV